MTDLKNALKYIAYTFKDGPWKHTFCKFGYNPQEDKNSVIYQIFFIKIKQKGVEDYG